MKSKNKNYVNFMLAVVFATITFGNSSVTAQILRSQVISNAEAYEEYTWTATSSNIKNDVNCGGKRIRTPNWVQVGSNTSLPYCWGGNTALSSYNARMSEGKCAGDNRTKSSGYTFGVEPGCTAGVDCSGFVSRSLGRSWHTGTSGLNGISNVTSWNSLKPGDFVNRSGNHTRLVHTVNANGTINMIESSRSYDKVHYRNYTSGQHSAYSSRRYKNIIDGPVNPTPPPPPPPPPPSVNCSESKRITTSGNIASQTVQTSVNIISTANVTSTANVIFKSPDVYLNNGFTILNGGEFYAENVSCNLVPKIGQPIVEGETNLNVYPNPVTISANIHFIIKDENPVSIFLTDITGKEIDKIVENEQFDKGRNQLNFSAENYSAGVYFISLKSNNQYTTSKFIIN